MAPDEGASRPPRRVNRARAPRVAKRVGGAELISQLNDMVAELIKENRKLKREVDKLTARGSAAASSAVERSLRTIQRRVQRALKTPAKRKRPAGATARRKTATRKRRKP
jgi:molybdenum-dependent DNA-binding transcriptional regulator ModE